MTKTGIWPKLVGYEHMNFIQFLVLVRKILLLVQMLVLELCLWDFLQIFIN